MTDLVGYTADALTFDINIDPAKAAAAGITTFIGGACRVDALNVSSGASVQGSATITGALKIRCSFAGNTLDDGNHKIQVRANPIGYARIVVKELDAEILPTPSTVT